MRFLMTAVLLSIACLAFAGCAESWEEYNAHTNANIDRWNKHLGDAVDSSNPLVASSPLELRWTHRDWLEKEDALNYRIHNGRCDRWNQNWVPLPPDQASVWRRRRNAEQEKPEHKWDMKTAMTDPDTGKRYRIGCWGCYGKN